MSQNLTSAVTREGAAIGTISATGEALRRIEAGEVLDALPPRQANGEEVERVRGETRGMIEALANRHLRKALRAGGGPEGVLAVLRDAATYRARTRFDDGEAMGPLMDRLRTLMADNRKLTFVLPVGGGKVPNPAKTGDRHLPDVTEWVAAVRLAAICIAIQHFYSPGAAVVMVPDAPLHTGDLGFSYPDGAAHVTRLRADLQALGIERCVIVANTTDHLPAEWSGEVLRRAGEARERLLTDEDFARGVDAQVQSLLFSINLRVYGWPFERVVMVNAALAGACRSLPPDVLADADDIVRQTRRVVPHYVGVNHALRTLDVPAHVARDLLGHPDYLRLSVHAKAGEPRPMLTQESRLARPGLLPMHGLALRFESKERPRYTGLFEVEARIHNLRPVIEARTGRLLFYEPRGGPEAIEALLPASAGRQVRRDKVG